MDPVGHVDPLDDLVRPLAVPRQVFGQMAVAFRRVDAEALQHVDAHLFLLADHRMALEGGDEFFLADLAALDAHIDIPGLVVDARADEIKVFMRNAQHLGNLFATMLDAMAEPDRIDLAVIDRRPGIHHHGVGIVEELRTRFSDLTDVLAEIQDDRDVALAVQNAARADRIAHALVDTIFQGDAYIVGISLKTTDTDAGHDIASALNSLAAVRRRADADFQTIGLFYRGQNFFNKGEIVLGRIRQRKLDAFEFRHFQNVREKLAREFDATRANDGDLETHCSLPCISALRNTAISGIGALPAPK